ncbi:hypothetical protein LOD99_9268 [Oopsacas minuta]|uniref:Peptidase A1 domain-containing protein n=1 Tax=Oopsacas minuta TaxID=111878 RepID=A0AAV7JC52_9METZ|nr:hypothetical protein LOD99_9268 [Oopsacas minuta]
MYSRVCLLCIIVTLSLGYVASKPGAEENDRIFSVNFDVIHPRDRFCKLMSNQSKCEVKLSGIMDAALVNNLDDAMRYIITIKIGKKQQAFKVLLDTGADILWVFSDECLDEEDENCEGHAKYELEEDKEYKIFKIGYADGEVSGVKVADEIHLATKLIVKDVMFGAAGEVNDEYEGYDGIMGLNMYLGDGEPSIIYYMIKQKLIKEPSYSIYLKGGATAVDGGEITFGGHNEKLVNLKIDGVKAKMIAGGKTRTKMTSLKLGEEFFCGKDINKCIALLDTGNADMHVQKNFLDKINSILKPGDDGLVDCKTRESTPAIEIMFGKHLITLEAKYYIQEDDRECFSTIKLNDFGEDFDWSFGVPLFVKYYVQFDFKAKNEAICFYAKL